MDIYRRILELRPGWTEKVKVVMTSGNNDPEEWRAIIGLVVDYVGIARAQMRAMVKRLLKKYKYPPEGLDDAIKTVIAQCEMWADEG